MSAPDWRPHRVATRDWPSLRDLSLRCGDGAAFDDPAAADDIAGWPASIWRERVHGLTGPSRWATAAVDQTTGSWCGLLAAYADGVDDDRYAVVRTCIIDDLCEPPQSRAAVHALFDAMEEWAYEEEARDIIVEVAQPDTVRSEFFAERGYRPTGITRDDDDDIRQVEWSRSVDLARIERPSGSDGRSLAG